VITQAKDIAIVVDEMREMNENIISSRTKTYNQVAVCLLIIINMG
jgi:hypothetical protein